MYVVMRLVKKLDLDTGQRIDCSGMQGCEGMLPVFTTKEEAREIYGEDVGLLPIGVDDNHTKKEQQ